MKIDTALSSNEKRQTHTYTFRIDAIVSCRIVVHDSRFSVIL